MLDTFVYIQMVNTFVYKCYLCFLAFQMLSLYSKQILVKAIRKWLTGKAFTFQQTKVGKAHL